MPKGELAGLKVLVTRPSHQAGALCELIEAAGGKAVAFPLLEVDGVEETAPLRQLLDHLTDYWLAIFISPNAVRFGLEAAARHGGIPATLQLAAVGEGSRRELEQRLGRRVDLVPQQHFDSEGLLALPALQQVAGKRIVIFRGNGGRELLAETLRERSAQVDYAEVYRRHPTAAPERATLAGWIAGGVNAVTVTSSAALQALHDMLDEAGRDWLFDTPLFVVSERCAALARQLGFRQPVQVARHAADRAIMESLAAWARSKAELPPENRAS
ncbi:MAG TPA: uroporphyrinogen-III synthase [Gammaproteobacteria bacterium]